MTTAITLQPGPEGTYTVRSGGSDVGHAEVRPPWIGVLEIRADVRGCGIGAAVADELERRLRAAGQHQAWVAVRLDNPGALRFWKRQGYRVVREGPNDEGQPCRALVKPLVATGRLAPTPSGRLHLGNALAFGAAWLSARNAGGRVLLRIEDLDRGRARDDVAAGQREDLAWLGIDWDEEVAPQSTRRYDLDAISTYRCDCPRTVRLEGGCGCRGADKTRGAWRFRTPRGEVAFIDRACGAQRFAPDEDPILQRADGEPAYPLAVVIDDARDGVTEVVRGGDLLAATATQILLGQALDLPRPSYLHVPLLLGPDGKKLSKSHGSTEIHALRAAGATPLEIWRRLLPLLGLPPGPLAGARLDPARMPAGPHVVT